MKEAMCALAPPLLAWLLSGFLLSGGLWAVYVLLARRLGTAAERFRWLRLSFVALLILPWVPALRPVTAVAPPLWQLLQPPTGPAVAMPSMQSAVGGQELFRVAVAVAVAVYLSWVLRCAIRLLVSARRLRRLLRGAPVLPLAAPAPVLLHDGDLAPATVGIVRPKILISRRIHQQLGERELQLILCHEAVHIRRRDALFQALVVLLRDLLCISPFVRALARHFESEMELSVDAAVLAQPGVVRRVYGQLLVTLATQLRAEPEPVRSGLFVARSLIARRIYAMSMPVAGKRRRALGVVSLVAFSLLAGAGVSALRLSPVAWAGASAASAATKASESADTNLQIYLVEPGGSRTIAQPDGPPLTLSAAPVLTQEDVDGATFNAGAEPTLGIHLRPSAAARFGTFTGSHIGQRMAIVLAGKLLAAPVIKAKIDGGNLMLSGQFPAEMRRLADAINGKPAAAPQR